MPISSGKYVAPTWVNSTTPPIDADELQDICDSIESYADPVASVPSIPNPNILDNWYFVGGGSQQNGGQLPVNGSGATSYSAGAYCIDRWYNRANMTASLVSNGLKLELSATGGYPFLSQRLTNGLDYLGKELTISVYVSEVSSNFKGFKARVDLSNSVSTNTSTSIATSFITTTGVHSITGTMPDTTTYSGVNFTLYLGATNRAVGDYCVISAVKLELGNTQTLAHQENGSWVLNEIPNFDIQYARSSELPSVPARYEIGSYVGTGTSGSAYPNSLTFSFVPKLVMIRRGTYERYCLFNAINGCSSIRNNVESSDVVNLSWNGFTLQWYGSSSYIQQNYSNATYYYTAIG